jgi:hypothetical protein
MTKLLNGECRECGGQFEFPAEAVGTTATCPHCGKPTEIILAAPAHERILPLRTIILTGIAILILVGGLVAAIIALKRAERMTGRNSATPTAVPAAPVNK